MEKGMIMARYGLVGVRVFVDGTVLGPSSNQTSPLSSGLLSQSTGTCEVINAASMNARPGYF